jgi:DNA-directed RNA polymerase subunit L
MEIRVLSEDKEKMEFEIDGEDHTLCNALKDALWKQPNVEIAAYSLEHPLVNKVKMIVGVNKGDVRGTILKAVETIKKETKELKTEFSKKV